MTRRLFRTSSLLAAAVTCALVTAGVTPAFAADATPDATPTHAAETAPTQQATPGATPDSGSTSTSETAATPETAAAPDATSTPSSTSPSASTSTPEVVTAQEAAPAATSRSTSGATVLSGGALKLGAGEFTGIVNDRKRKGVRTFDAFRLGVVDATSTLAGDPARYAPTWTRAEDTVIHFSDALRNPATQTWSSPLLSTPEQQNAYVSGGAGRLALSFEMSTGGNGRGVFPDADAVARNTQDSPTTRLVKVTGPAGGRFTATQYREVEQPEGSGTFVRDDLVLWDSATLGTDTPPAVNGLPWQGWSFSSAGVYCLTVRQDLLTVRTPSADGSSGAQARTAQATYTVLVGDAVDPATVAPCAQVPSSGGGDSGGGTPIYTPTLLSMGHLDMRAVLNGAGDGIDFGVKQTGFVDSKNTVLAGTYGPVAVGAGASPLDDSLIGPAGTRYWYYEQGGFDGDHLWPGLSTEGWKLSDVGPAAQIDFTMTGVVGPTSDARVLLFSDPSSGSRTRPSDVWFDSTKLPMTRTETIGGHSHMNWAFTAAGRYCLGMTAKTQLASGRWVSDRGILTVWVGDPSQAAAVQPCERDATVSMPQPAPAALDVSPTTAALSPTTGSTDLVIALTGGAIDTVARVQAAAADPERLVNAQDVIYRAMAFSDGTFRTGSAIAMRLDTSRVAPARLAEPMTLSIGQAAGPGSVVLRSTLAGVAARLDPAAGRRSLELPGWTNDGSQWVFDARGVYCLPITWTATPAGSSTPVSVTKVLTVAAGIDDTTGLTSCARGQQPGVPSDGGGGIAPSDPEVWNVPNGSTNAAGAVVLNDGHVDLASVLDGDRLVTRVKDSTSVADDPVWRDPAQTVFQLLPGAQTTVPSDAVFGFLGSPGSPIWQVTQTQQSELGLLWPGWSTEAIPLDRTRAGVRWSLDRMTGPGEFALYTSGQSFGSVDVKFSTRDGITAADAFEIPKITHAHGTWAFTAEGAYCLGFTRSATLADGRGVTDSFTLAVAVGRTDVTKIDPARCFDDAGKPALPDLLPVPSDRLTEATRGGVDTVGDADAVAGQLVALRVGTARAGQWVSVWAHGDTARWLGWVRVDGDGAARVRLPVDLARGAQRLVVKSANGDLIGWASTTVRDAPAAPVTSVPDEDTTPAPAVAAVCSATSGAIIASGHVDWNAQVVDGRLRTFVGDDSSGTRVYRDPASTVLWLKPSSTVTIPASLSRIGVPGSTVWQIPQTQRPGVVWLGWSTELLHAGLVNGPVSWSLTSIEGPGGVRVFTTGSFGGVQDVVFDGTGTASIPLGVHAHANWTFTQQGLYRLHFTQSATLSNGQRSSSTEVLTIAVGDADPRAGLPSAPGCAGGARASVSGDASVALAAPAAQLLPDAARLLQDGPAGAGVIRAEDRTGPLAASSAASGTVPILMSVLGALLLLSAAASGVLWRRRVRP